MARLESLLDTTAGMLREPVACCEGAGRPGNPKLYSHAGLRRWVRSCLWDKGWHEFVTSICLLVSRSLCG